ncbi:MAG: chemotaxis protein CheW [Oscillospiraceae bacterium]
MEDFNQFNQEKDQLDTLKGKYLTFWINSQLFGVPIGDVVQIVGMQQITEIPEFPSYAKGVINLRGSIIPVIDVRLRFKKEEIPYTERTCNIVTNINGHYMGLIVDAVEEVTTIDDENICPPPRMQGDHVNEYLTGIGKQADLVILLLDTAKIINESELIQMQQEITA